MTVLFSVSGWPNNFADTVTDYETPQSGDPENLIYVEQQVYPPVEIP